TGYGAGKILVGMPRRTDGSEGPEAASVRKILSRLKDRFPDMEILTWDERFTTVIATSALLEADVSRAGRKGVVDKVAAALMLQSYLDSNRGAEISGAAALTLPSFEAPSGRKQRGKKNYR
ncbi:MAG: Holliday junction resolvase RuvX, partial [Synergistaceae bacterium]|nr:Holliday junction resolvase RuvX [Synergistaceae bacterium]